MQPRETHQRAGRENSLRERKELAAGRAPETGPPGARGVPVGRGDVPTATPGPWRLREGPGRVWGRRGRVVLGHKR